MPRRFPNLWIEGAFNKYGYDAGLPNQMKLGPNATWSINLQAEWPVQISMNAWGINPDGQPDVTRVFGDIDGGKPKVVRFFVERPADRPQTTSSTEYHPTHY